MYRYQPIPGELSNWSGTQLGDLRSVSEGWYVDYKRDGLTAPTLAKHMSAFANEFGGWLFLGIQDSGDAQRNAVAFPGLPDSEIDAVRKRVTSAVVDHVTPRLRFEDHVIRGPVPEIGLEKDRSILVLGIPEGLQPPYVHSSGRVFTRVADASDPTYIRDHRDLLHLWQKRDRARARLAEFASATPSVSDAEAHMTWAHLYLLTDLQIGERFLDLPFGDFCRLLKHPPKPHGVFVPMDAFYPARHGYLARQVAGHDPSILGLTFRWWHSGNVRISIPIRTYPHDSARDGLQRYQHAGAFCDVLDRQGFGDVHVADLAQFVHVLAALLRSYMDLREHLADSSNMYARVILTNAWRLCPFIDDAEYIKQVTDTGVPLVEDAEVEFPHEVDFDSLIELSTVVGCDSSGSSGEPAGGDAEGLPESMLPYWVATPLAYAVLSSLGVMSDPDDFRRYIGLLDFEALKKSTA